MGEALVLGGGIKDFVSPVKQDRRGDRQSEQADEQRQPAQPEAEIPDHNGRQHEQVAEQHVGHQPHLVRLLVKLLPSRLDGIGIQALVENLLDGTLPLRRGQLA